MEVNERLNIFKLVVDGYDIISFNTKKYTDLEENHIVLYASAFDHCIEFCINKNNIIIRKEINYV